MELANILKEDLSIIHGETGARRKIVEVILLNFRSNLRLMDKLEVI